LYSNFVTRVTRFH